MLQNEIKVSNHWILGNFWGSPILKTDVVVISKFSSIKAWFELGK